MTYSIESKLTKSGVIYTIYGTTKRGNSFACGKRYWIEAGSGTGRTAISRSNSLNYLQKKLAKMT